MSDVWRTRDGLPISRERPHTGLRLRLRKVPVSPAQVSEPLQEVVDVLEQKTWNGRTLRSLEAAYLNAANVYGGSGFRGDANRWERARRVIATAVDRDGSFLDVGCANGLLMESIHRWTEQAGYAVEPYGLDLSPALVQLARRRLPAWADRIFVGDVTTWEPPHRFDFVRTELSYMAPAARPRFVERCLDTLVAPGGRLIVCSYGSSRPNRPRVEPIVDHLDEWGIMVSGHAEAIDTNGIVFTRVAWIDGR